MYLLTYLLTVQEFVARSFIRHFYMLSPGVGVNFMEVVIRWKTRLTIGTIAAAAADYITYFILDLFRVA